MKNMIFALVVIFSSCTGFDVYVSDEVIEYEDNTVYSVTSDGTISGDLIYYNGSMLSKEISEAFEYSCRTSSPCIVFDGTGDEVTISITYNDVEYTETGTGALILTVP